MSHAAGSKAAKVPRYPIESVLNAARILEFFVDAAELRITDVAQQLDVSPSTAHRLLTTLAARGLIEQNGLTRCYQPGPGLLRIAKALVPDASGWSFARPYMTALAERVGETVNLILRHGTEVSFAESVESGSSVRVGSRRGAIMPAHSTSGGKILLAALPEAEVRELYPGVPAAGRPGGADVDPEALLTQLRQAGKRGYATNFGESEPGISGLAVRVQTARRGDCALAVAVPAGRVPAARVRELVTELRLTAEALAGASAT
ncbi:MAG: IclR family transcriptional regulator [Nostocoides sp.]